jgi:hypothetical protein
MVNFKEIITEHNVILVHFYTNGSKMKKETLFKKIDFDLTNTGRAISSSTIGINDSYRPRKKNNNFDELNALGNVGIIIAPTAESNSVCYYKDGGFSGSIGVDSRSPNKCSFENSIKLRRDDKYNEIELDNYYVKGIFLFNPDEITDFDGYLPEDGVDAIQHTKYTIEELIDYCDRNSLNCYTINRLQFFKVLEKGNVLMPITVEGIYL